MGIKVATAATLAAGLALSGCAEFTHLTRDRDLTSYRARPHAAFIDAKQRAVITTHPQAKFTYDERGKRRFVPGRPRVCAEPSPDALSALAASQGFSLTKGTDLGANAAASLSESAASIGLRTQSIQLMRDAMYRICEGHMSGALTDGSFETLHRRLQSSMVAILAIEQLTGAVKANQVILSGSAATGSADAVLKLTEQTATARSAVAAAEKDVATAEEAKKQAKTAEETATAAAKANDKDEALAKAAKEAQDKLKAATDKLTAAQATLAEKEGVYKAADEGRRAALSGTTDATSDGKFIPISNTPPLSAAAADSVAEAIQNIVKSTLEQRYSDELCTTLMIGIAYDDELTKTGGAPSGRSDAQVKIIEGCNRLLQATAAAMLQQTAETQANGAAYRAALARLTPQQVFELWKAQLARNPQAGEDVEDVDQFITKLFSEDVPIKVFTK